MNDIHQSFAGHGLVRPQQGRVRRRWSLSPLGADGLAEPPQLYTGECITVSNSYSHR